MPARGPDEEQQRSQQQSAGGGGGVQFDSIEERLNRRPGPALVEHIDDDRPILVYECRAESLQREEQSPGTETRPGHMGRAVAASGDQG